MSGDGKSISIQPTSLRYHYFLLTLSSAALSIAALLFYYHRGAILLYGDAVAHINIARRVFDSRTPGPFQLGTVWLPLPHLLAAPFIVNGWLWRTGVGASIPSMLAYVAGTLGVFRLVQGLASRGAAWIAAFIFALNPNLVYIQSTAMTEPLYLALFIWTLAFFSEFARGAVAEPEAAARSLQKCALTLCAAMLVRYDAWFLASFVAAASIVIALLASSVSLVQTAGSRAALKSLESRPPAQPARRSLAQDILKLVVLVGVTAGLWLAYNQVSYGNSLEFANGPYSARAIQKQSRTPTMPTYPGENSPRTATLYFLKVARLNLGQGAAGSWPFGTAVVAALSAIFFSRRFLPWLLLWTPAWFYIFSIAWGSVPIYFPEWWPYSYYNVRYGLELLPAVAVFVALAFEFLLRMLPDIATSRRSSRWAAIAVIVVVAAGYGFVWRETPICFREAEANGRIRLEFDQQLAAELKKLPPWAEVMMDGSAHPGAVQAAGIPFRRVLRESNPPQWEIALTQPALSADYVVAIQGDEVYRAVRLFPGGLDPVSRVDVAAGLNAVIYRSAKKKQSAVSSQPNRSEAGSKCNLESRQNLYGEC